MTEKIWFLSPLYDDRVKEDVEYGKLHDLIHAELRKSFTQRVYERIYRRIQNPAQGYEILNMVDETLILVLDTIESECLGYNKDKNINKHFRKYLKK